MRIVSSVFKSPDELLRRWCHVGETDACWPLRIKCKIRGYGRVWVGNKQWAAHRYVWTMCFGPIPEGLCVCHKCDVPSCLNPRHLFLDTNAGNTADKMRKGRQAWGEKTKQSDMTAREVWHIRRCMDGGLSHYAAARIMGTTRPAMGYIARRIVWKRLRAPT